MSRVVHNVVKCGTNGCVKHYALAFLCLTTRSAPRFAQTAPHSLIFVFANDHNCRWVWQRTYVSTCHLSTLANDLCQGYCDFSKDLSMSQRPTYLRDLKIRIVISYDMSKFSSYFVRKYIGILDNLLKHSYSTILIMSWRRWWVQFIIILVIMPLRLPSRNYKHTVQVGSSLLCSCALLGYSCILRSDGRVVPESVEGSRVICVSGTQSNGSKNVICQSLHEIDQSTNMNMMMHSVL